MQGGTYMVLNVPSGVRCSLRQKVAKVPLGSCSKRLRPCDANQASSGSQRARYGTFAYLRHSVRVAGRLETGKWMVVDDMKGRGLPFFVRNFLMSQRKRQASGSQPDDTNSDRESSRGSTSPEESRLKGENPVLVASILVALCVPALPRHSDSHRLQQEAQPGQGLGSGASLLSNSDEVSPVMPVPALYLIDIVC